MEDQNILLIGKLAFWISFFLGNVCLFGYVITRNDEFAAGGITLLGAGCMINSLIALGLLIYGIIVKTKLNICLKAVGIMLINIPIAIIYAVIGINIINV
ncbi:hypothetical protein GCM10022217_19080 [Chryseobacterium ginsenosidimutans]|uniref:hypothetical protein n=1 Tax=Chryseobacterium ginsenosidimutans TaxID=687846 RepID=UPI0031DC79B1